MSDVFDLSTASAPVTTSDTVTAGTTERTGEGDSSMDALDDYFLPTQHKSPTPKKESKQKSEEKKEEKKVDMPAEAIEAVKKSESKKDSKDELSKAEKPKEQKEAKTKDSGKEDEKAKLEAQAKKIKAKRGDQEIDLQDDDLIPVKINGKEELLSLKELREDRAGKVQWDKKFSELSKERNQFMGKLKDAEDRIKAIFETKDPTEKFFKMAELAGKSPIEARRAFLDENIPLLEKWYSMSEDERARDEIEFENKYLKHQQETQKRQSELKQVQETLSAKIESLRAAHKIEREQFSERYELLKGLRDQGTLVDESGKPVSITPEFVAETIVKDNMMDFAEKALAEESIALDESTKAQKLMKLCDLAYSQGLPPEEIPAMVSDIWGKGKAKQVAKQKEQQRQEFYEGKKESAPSYQKPDSDVWSFEQL